VRDVFIEALTELAVEREDVFLITGDLGFGVLDKFAERFPRQYLNVGVAEQNMTGIAAGLALEGYRVFTYSIANFSTLRCLEQIRNDVCYHDANVTVVSIGGGFGYGALGMSHHATEDLSIMRAIPNLRVLVPGDDYEAMEATKYAASTPGPSYLRLERAPVKSVDTIEEPFTYGKIRVLQKGDDFSVFCSGGVTAIAMNVAKALKREGIAIRVHSVHSLKSIDKNVVSAAVSETKGLITLEENNLKGGLGSAISEVCMDFGLYPKKFVRLGLHDTYSSVVGSQEFLRSHYGIDEAKLEKTIRSMIEV
jgi:transketolase